MIVKIDGFIVPACGGNTVPQTEFLSASLKEVSSSRVSVLSWAQMPIVIGNTYLPSTYYMPDSVPVIYSAQWVAA